MPRLHKMQVLVTQNARENDHYTKYTSLKQNILFYPSLQTNQ